jgi:hypothetical protein
MVTSLAYIPLSTASMRNNALLHAQFEHILSRNLLMSGITETL